MSRKTREKIPEMNEKGEKKREEAWTEMYKIRCACSSESPFGFPFVTTVNRIIFKKERKKKNKREERKGRDRISKRVRYFSVLYGF